MSAIALDNGLDYELDYFTVQRHFSPRGALWHTTVHTLYLTIILLHDSKSVNRVL